MLFVSALDPLLLVVLALVQFESVARGLVHEGVAVGHREGGAGRLMPRAGGGPRRRGRRTVEVTLLRHWPRIERLAGVLALADAAVLDAVLLAGGWRCSRPATTRSTP